jgi:hypothetical protein
MAWQVSCCTAAHASSPLPVPARGRVPLRQADKIRLDQPLDRLPESDVGVPVLRRVVVAAASPQPAGGLPPATPCVSSAAWWL